MYLFHYIQQREAASHNLKLQSVFIQEASSSVDDVDESGRYLVDSASQSLGFDENKGFCSPCLIREDGHLYLL